MSLDELRPLPGYVPGKPYYIAGPCSAESCGQVLETARELSRAGVAVFRAGLWKPRTHPGGFEGVGEAGLEWLAEVKRETGMYVATEVATREHVIAALHGGVDLLWIGARTSANPFAVQEIADTLREMDADAAVMVKNPVSPDLELWIGALQRLHSAGVRHLGAIHRGFSTYGRGPLRNPPHWSIPIELRRRVPGMPLVCDPSHIAGRRDLVPGIATEAMAMGFGGLIVECHPTPTEALSDAAQQLTPAEFISLISSLPCRKGSYEEPELEELRRQIDRIDAQLLDILAQRMSVSRRIGDLKRRNGMTVVQPDRYRKLIETRRAEGAALGLGPEFLETILRAIHEESVRQQIREN